MLIYDAPLLSGRLKKIYNLMMISVLGCQSEFCAGDWSLNKSSTHYVTFPKDMFLKTIQPLFVVFVFPVTCCRISTKQYLNDHARSVFSQQYPYNIKRKGYGNIQDDHQ